MVHTETDQRKWINKADPRVLTKGLYSLLLMIGKGLDNLSNNGCTF